MKRKMFLSWIIMGSLIFSQAAWARIKLAALPERQATVVRLDNPTATLVEEERVLTLQEGVNKIDFSWKNVQIQTDSIRLTVLDHLQPVTLLSVSYPNNEEALVWEVGSPVAQQVRARISYLLNYIDRLVTYSATVNKEETALMLDSFLVLRNFSGENLATARFQLDYGETFEGTSLNNETKKIQFFTAANLPIRKRFTFDAGVLPWDPKQEQNNVSIPVQYELDNRVEAGLGKHALWDGKTRLYQEDGHGSTIFLGEDNVEFTPVGQPMQLTIGKSRDVVVTQRKMSEQRLNERRNNENKVVLYDTEEVMQVEIENFKNLPAAVTLKEPMPMEWEMKQQSHEYTREHNQLINFNIDVPAKQKVTVAYTYYQRNLKP
jgi:hypothetical protein